MAQGIDGRIEAGLADQPQGTLLVGLSGGLDSVTLLHALQRSGAARARGLRALHVHHGLHPGADDWAVRCQALCDALAVPLTIVSVVVDRDAGLGLEGAAREARLAAFAAALDDDAIIALAHHGNDQAETFLLRALRASGDGLAAMPTWRRLGRGWLWRPWLDVPRGDLQAYARCQGLAWSEDPGNAELERDRNFLRHRVLPLLRERWPRADELLARSAALARADRSLLEDDDARALAEVATACADTLQVDALRALPLPRQARVLRHWTRRLGLPPLPAQGVARTIDVLLAASGDGQAEFAWAGARILRWRDLLHASTCAAPLPGDWSACWDGVAPLQLPTGDCLSFEPAATASCTAGAAASATPDAPAKPGTGNTPGTGSATTALTLPLRVHTRQGGERILLPGRRHSHALKQVLQACGVPPWERARLPLLSDATGTLLAAGDITTSASFAAWLQASGRRLAWSRAGQGLP